jgi:Tol biopolymer transport system component
VSGRTGSLEVWAMDANGANPVQISDLKSVARHPRWSPSGRHIAFRAAAPGPSHEDIYVVDVATGVSRRVTQEASNDQWPTWSADGEWIYFMSDRSGAREIWKVPVGGGRAAQVTTGGGLKAWESRDGRFLYYSNDAPAIWRKPTGPGDRALVLELPAGTAWGGEWFLASDGIYWLNGKASPRPAIEFFSFATGRVRRAVTPSGAFDDGGGFSVAPDGRWLVFGQRDYHGSDIMVIEGIQ